MPDSTPEPEEIFVVAYEIERDGRMRPFLFPRPGPDPEAAASPAPTFTTSAEVPYATPAGISYVSPSVEPVPDPEAAASPVAETASEAPIQQKD